MSSSTDLLLQKKVGQLFVAGFHGYEPNAEIKSLIKDYGLGAVILFRRNIKDAEQLQALTLALQQEAKQAGHENPLFIGIDQENGLVTRIAPPIAAQQPGQMTLGATKSTDDNAYEVGKATGEMLDFFGINMNYAPSCDVNSEPLNPVIGVRSAGDNPEFVARIACATARGLRDSSRVVPTVKHFPGHGDTAVDSHYGLPSIAKSRSELERCELTPFRRAVAEGIEAVMTAHIALPKLHSESDSSLPATLSPEALGILRGDMKYDGLVISDCLEMDGIRATYGTVEGSVMSLKAGADCVMICHTYDVQVESMKRVMKAVKSGELSESMLSTSLRRIETVKKRFLNWDHTLRSATGAHISDSLAEMNARHEKIARRVYSDSTTVVRNSLGRLPMSKLASDLLLLIPSGNLSAGGAVEASEEKHRTYLDVLQGVVEGTGHSVKQLEYQTCESCSENDWSMIDNESNTVVVVSQNANVTKTHRVFILEVARRRKDAIVIATCSPYDFINDDDLVKTYVTVYEPTIEAFSAAVDVIFRGASSQGSLPVAQPQPGKARVDKGFRIVAVDDESNESSTIAEIIRLWNLTLPDHALPADNLYKVIDQPHGHHMVAQDTNTNEIIGFCLSYTSLNQGTTSAEIAAIAVDPAYRHRGIGTELLLTTREYLYEHYGTRNALLRSYFPRFWPGLPADLQPEIEDFFLHRGFRFTRSTDADLFQDIRQFVPPQRYIQRAAAAGITYRAISTEEEYEACLVGQKRNFSTYTGWVESYISLHPSKHPSSIMAAFDNQTGTQIAWTLMLSPDDDFVAQNWAFLPLAASGTEEEPPLKTGLIGCVGVDEAYRSKGVGLAMLCHAIEDMKGRGVEGAFIDSTDKVLWYGKLGFGIWKKYIRAEI